MTTRGTSTLVRSAVAAALLLGCFSRIPAAEWNRVDSNTTDDLNAVWGAATNKVWFAADFGRLLRYNGNFYGLDIPIDEVADQLFAVWGSSENDIYAGGDSGVLIHYDGMNWTRIDLGVTDRVTDIQGSGPDDVYVVGGRFQGFAFHWNGSTWTRLMFQKLDYDDFGLPKFTDPDPNAGALNCLWRTQAGDWYAGGEFLYKIGPTAGTQEFTLYVKRKVNNDHYVLLEVTPGFQFALYEDGYLQDEIIESAPQAIRAIGSEASGEIIAVRSAFFVPNVLTLQEEVGAAYRHDGERWMLWANDQPVGGQLAEDPSSPWESIRPFDRTPLYGAGDVAFDPIQGGLLFVGEDARFTAGYQLARRPVIYRYSAGTWTEELWVLFADIADLTDNQNFGGFRGVAFAGEDEIYASGPKGLIYHAGIGADYYWSGRTLTDNWHFAAVDETNWNDSQGVQTDVPGAAGDEKVFIRESIPAGGVIIDHADVAVGSLQSDGKLVLRKKLTLSEDSSIHDVAFEEGAGLVFQPTPQSGKSAVLDTARLLAHDSQFEIVNDGTILLRDTLEVAEGSIMSVKLAAGSHFTLDDTSTLVVKGPLVSVDLTGDGNFEFKGNSDESITAFGLYNDVGPGVGPEAEGEGRLIFNGGTLGEFSLLYNRGTMEFIKGELRAERMVNEARSVVSRRAAERDMLRYHILLTGSEQKTIAATEMHNLGGLVEQREGMLLLRDTRFINEVGMYELHGDSSVTQAGLSSFFNKDDFDNVFFYAIGDYLHNGTDFQDRAKSELIKKGGGSSEFGVRLLNHEGSVVSMDGTLRLTGELLDLDDNGVLSAGTWRAIESGIIDLDGRQITGLTGAAGGIFTTTVEGNGNNFPALQTLRTVGDGALLVANGPLVLASDLTVGSGGGSPRARGGSSRLRRSAMKGKWSRS